MIIQLNGESKEFNDGITVKTLIQQQTQTDSATGIAIAINGQIIRRTQWETTIFSSGDDVEILQAVAGG